MDDVRENVAAERQRVETTLTELSGVIGRKDLSPLELAGVATFLLNTYNGIENVLKQALKAQGVRLQATETWHRQVLNEAEERGIITPELRRELQPFLGFRHFFVHGYGYMLDEAPLMKLAGSVHGVWSQLISQVERHLAG